MTDNVNHPAHYAPRFETYPVECINVTCRMDFCRGNAFKYIWRAGSKGDKAKALEDCDKALFYLKYCPQPSDWNKEAFAVFNMLKSEWDSPRYTALFDIVTGDIAKAEDEIRTLRKQIEAEEVPKPESAAIQQVKPEPETKKPRATEKIWFDYEGDHRIHGITDEQIALWRESYPAINIESELGAAAAWLDGNPKNRKTDVKRFLVNWMKRAQDRAPRVATTEPQHGPHWSENERGLTDDGHIF